MTQYGFFFDQIVARNKLVLKHKSAADVMRYTRCDE